MTAKRGYSLSFIPPGFLLPSFSIKCDSMSFLSFTLSVNGNVVDGVASLAEVISNKFVSPVFDVHTVFFDAGVKGASSFTDAELSASGAMNDVYS